MNDKPDAQRAAWVDRIPHDAEAADTTRARDHGHGDGAGSSARCRLQPRGYGMMNSQIEPARGHLPLMSNLETVGVKPILPDTLQTMPDAAPLGAPSQVGADRLDAAVKRAAKLVTTNSQIEPPLGHLPLMSSIEFDAPGQAGVADTRGMDGLADRLDAAVKRAADGRLSDRLDT